jgi:hypothetical protein
MPILTAADTSYLGELNLFGDELLAAIRTALLLAEGLSGARRSLSVTQYTETHTLSRETRSFFPSMMPILADPVPTVRLKASGSNSFGRTISASQWVTLTSEQFEIDSYLGQVQILDTYETYLENRYLDRVEITYSSGFDFDVETPETATIKQAIANIIRWQNPGALPQSQGAIAQISSGIQQFSLNNVYSVSYADGADGRYRESLLDSSLQVLKKYRPRGIL